MEDMFKECKELSMDTTFDREEGLASDAVKDCFGECKELDMSMLFGGMNDKEKEE